MIGVLDFTDLSLIAKSVSIFCALEPEIDENKTQTLLTRLMIKCNAIACRTSIIGLWFIVTFLWWNFWQKVWHKAQSRIILMPPQAYEKLVRDAREAMKREGKTDVRFSTGDVIAA